MRGSEDRRYARPEVSRHLDGAGLNSLAALSDRSLGERVTDRRTSWVRRTSIDAFDVFIKTYDYPATRDRLRGALRTTWLAPSRAEREWEALAWMRAQGFAAPEPLALLQSRWYGVLQRAVLVTERYPGTALDQLLPELPRDDRDHALRTVETLVEALHAQGFRDRNLDLRNLLARRLEDGSFEVVKIDSPRFRLVAAGPAHDRLARADWDRLAKSIGKLKLKPR